MLTLDKVYQASQVLREVIRETDMILAPNIHPGTNVYLKTENLQVTGSFKIRGAYYKISTLSDEEKGAFKEACYEPCKETVLKVVDEGFYNRFLESYAEAETILGLN